MIVLDASTAVEALLRDGTSRQAMVVEPLRAPHLIDSEVLTALATHLRRGILDDETALAAVDVWRRVAVTRSASASMTGRIWELRHTVTPYDAAYVALAERLGCPLVTTDARLGRASGIRCAVTVLTR